MRFGRMAEVDRVIHGFGIPLLVLSMLGTTAVAGIPGYFFLVRALGPEHSVDALLAVFQHGLYHVGVAFGLQHIEQRM